MKRWGRVAQGGLGFGLALIFVLPVYWMVVAALRQPGLPPPRTVQWWPEAAHWENYGQLFRMVPMARYIRNSVLVVAAAIPITWLSAATAGFGMAQLPERQRRLLLVLCVILLMLPGSSVWIFRYQILRWLGLIDTLWALILPAFAASSPLFVLLFYWAYRRIPGEVFEAAQLDGAGVWVAWWRLGRPLVRPTSVGVVVLTFASYWGDFISPLLYTTGRNCTHWPWDCKSSNSWTRPTGLC